MSKNNEPIQYVFDVTADWDRSSAAYMLRDAIDGHSSFDFVIQKHDQAEPSTIEDCEPKGIFNTDIPMTLETREDGQYLVFACKIPARNQIKEVSILVSPPVETSLVIEDNRHQGIVLITNSVGDQYWFYF